jgi:hypothetical protein
MLFETVFIGVTLDTTISSNYINDLSGIQVAWLYWNITKTEFIKKSLIEIHQ